MGEFILNGRNYGGSIITPNPSDTPTDSLDSIKINDTIYEIQGGGSNLILDAHIFSMTEKQVGIWINNKPLYEKTIDCGLLPQDTSWHDIPHGIANMEDTVFVQGIGFNSALNEYYLCPIARPNSQQGICVFRHEQYIRYMNNWIAASTVRLYVTIQYTKTTDTAGSGGYQAYGFSPIVCSEAEREVGVWEDNKPLYQKTFIGTLGGTAGSDVSNYKMADLSNIDTIASISGTLQGITPINSYYASDNYNMVFVNGAKNGLYCNGKNIGGNTYKVTIQYTKTTDVAGSGEYNTLAIPNVHYSTDEQVIGTWIDGKTLYQKTLRLTSGIVTGSFQTIPLDSTCIVNNYQGFVRRTDKRVDNFNGFVQTTDALLLSARTNGMEYFIATRFTDITELCITVQYTKTTD